MSSELLENFDQQEAALVTETSVTRQDIDTFVSTLNPEQQKYIAEKSTSLAAVISNPNIKNDKRYDEWETALEQVDETLRNAIAASVIISTIESNTPTIRNLPVTETTKINTMKAFQRYLEQVKEFRTKRPKLYGRGTNLLGLKEFSAGDLIFDIRTLAEPIPEAIKTKFGIKAGTKMIFTHIPEKQPGEHLTEAGYLQSLNIIAGEMKFREDLEGCGSGSWLYDPSLADVSPNLAWVKKYAFQAEPLNTDPQQTALAANSSNTRKVAIESGVWNPRPHVIYLGREEFIRRFG